MAHTVTHDEIINAIILLIAGFVCVNQTEITKGSVLSDSPLNMDSLDMVEIAIEFESEFGIDITSDIFDVTKTVSDIASNLHKIISE